MATFTPLTAEQVAEMRPMIEYLEVSVDDVYKFEYKSMNVDLVCKRFLQFLKQCQKDDISFASVLAQCLAGGTLESLKRKSGKHGFEVAKWDPKATPSAVTPARASIILAPFLHEYCKKVYGDEPRQHGLSPGNYFPAVHCAAKLTDPQIVAFGKEWSALFNTKKKAKEIRAIMDHQYLEFARLQRALSVLTAPKGLTGTRLILKEYLKVGLARFVESEFTKDAGNAGEALPTEDLMVSQVETEESSDAGGGYYFAGEPKAGAGHYAGYVKWSEVGVL